MYKYAGFAAYVSSLCPWGVSKLRMLYLLEVSVVTCLTYSPDSLFPLESPVMSVYSEETCYLSTTLFIPITKAADNTRPAPRGRKLDFSSIETVITKLDARRVFQIRILKEQRQTKHHFDRTSFQHILCRLGSF